MNVPPDAVRAQLDRILASAGFASAERASRFLRYVVERAIAGEGDQLKEYVVGRAVFDRGDDYDPRLDAIVRVEAGRLRSKIDEYYSGTGREDPILIQLRRGSYAPAFQSRGREATSDAAAPAAVLHKPSRLGRNLGLAAVGFVVIALLTWRAGMWATAEGTLPTPTIAVLPFAIYSTDPAERMLAARVTDGVTGELARLGTLGVVSHTSARQYADVRPSLPEIARALNAQFVLEGNVRDAGGLISIQVRLVDASIDRKVWVQDFGGSDVPELQRQIAKATSAVLLQRR